MNSSPERDGFHALRTYYTKPGCVGKMVNIFLHLLKILCCTDISVAL